MRNLLAKLSNIIKRAAITLTNADDKVISYSQVKYLNNTALAENIYPYGMNANAPAGTISVLFTVGNNEGNLAAIPYCQSERFKNLKSGEVVVGSPSTGSYIKFDQGKTISINSESEINLSSSSIIPHRLLATDDNKNAQSSPLINWVHTSSLIVTDDSNGGININIPSLSDFTSTGGIIDDNDDYLEAFEKIDGNANSGLNSGLISGGTLSINSADNSKIDIAAGTGYLVNHTNAAAPVVTHVLWPAHIAVVLPDISTRATTWVGINSAGNVILSASDFSPDQLSTIIRIGRVNHFNRSVIDAVQFMPVLFTCEISHTSFVLKFGTIRLSDAIISPNGANNSFNIGEMSFQRIGSNFQINPNNPDVSTSAPITLASFHRGLRDGIGHTTFTMSQSALDPANYDNNGVLSPLPSTDNYTIQTLIMFPCGNTSVNVVLYGQKTYKTFSEAKAAVLTDHPSIMNDIAGGNIICFFIVDKAMTNLQADLVAGTAAIIAGENFDYWGAGGGGSSGAVGASTFQDIYHISPSPQIVTDSTIGSFKIKNGAAADSAFLQEWKNIAGTTRASVKGDGTIESLGGFIGDLTGNASTASLAALATLATHSTYLAGGAANYLPYQSGTGVTSFIAPVNNAVLTTNGSGVMGWSTSSPFSTTLQAAYNASTSPHITTTNALGAFRIKSWDFSGLATIQEWADSAGSVTASIDGNGKMVASGGFVGNLTGNASTATNVAGGLANYLPYQTAINTTSFITPVNNAILVTNGSGVPSWSTSIPVVGQDNVLLPTTTASVGLIKWNNVIVVHTYGANNNLFAGTSQGNFTLTGANDFSFGTGSLIGLTTGFNNGSFGYWNLRGLTTGQSNYAVGSSCANLLVSGNYNLFLGDAAGSAYTADESGNLCIHSPGVAGEWNTIRIGEPGTGAGQQNKAYIAGIYNIVPTSATKKIMLVADDHQVGSSTNLSFNSSTNTLSTTNFAGALTGNVTGNVSGSSGSCTGNSLTATTATNSNNASITELHTAATYYMTCVPTATSAYQQVYTSTNAPTIAMDTGRFTTASTISCKGGTSAGGIFHYRLMSTAGGQRVSLGLGVAETGSGNAGSNMYCWVYDDAGTFISSSYHVERATGVFYADVGLMLPTAGGTATLLKTNEVYTYTTTFTGGSITTGNVTFVLSQTGRGVHISQTLAGTTTQAYFPTTVGVFTANTLVPARFRPPQNTFSDVGYARLVIWTYYNGAWTPGMATIGSDGSFVISPNPNSNFPTGQVGWREVTGAWTSV